MQKQRKVSFPEFLLSDFYPSNAVLNSRGSYQKFGWLPAEPLWCDFRTGYPVSINGTLPVICSSAVCSDRVKRLLNAAGHPESSYQLVYKDRSDYETVLDDCYREQKAVVFQFPHHQDERPREMYWIDPDLLGRLNNKAFLSELVPECHLPQRRVFDVREYEGLLHSELTLPLVLKAAGNKPSGGGYSVFFIQTVHDLERARPSLEIAESFVIEEFLSIKENYCLNYAADGDKILFLGSSDQITNEAGQHEGNWLSLDRRPPREAIDVGFEIMRRAADLGYRGVAGFDIIRDSHGRILVIDLNFRLNASTPALMWHRRLLSRSGSKAVGRLINWEFQHAVDTEFSLLQEAVESGWVFPLIIYDPQASPYRFETVRVMGILFGSSRSQVEQRLRKIHRKFGVPAQRLRETKARINSSSKSRAA